MLPYRTSTENKRTTPIDGDLLESLPAILDGYFAALDTVLASAVHLNVTDDLRPGTGGHDVVVGAVGLPQGVAH